MRVTSRGAAVALAVLTGVLMLRFPPTASGPPAEQIGAISVVTIMATERAQPRPIERRHVETNEGLARPVAQTTTEGANGEGMRLWLDGASQRVVFTDGAHYMRCLEAQLQQVDAPDCPRFDRRFANADGARWGAKLSVERDRVGRPRAQRMPPPMTGPVTFESTQQRQAGNRPAQPAS